MCYLVSNLAYFIFSISSKGCFFGRYFFSLGIVFLFQIFFLKVAVIFLLVSGHPDH